MENLFTLKEKKVNVFSTDTFIAKHCQYSSRQVSWLTPVSIFPSHSQNGNSGSILSIETFVAFTVARQLTILT